jgi:hypothetical protein
MGFKIPYDTGSHVEFQKNQKLKLCIVNILAKLGSNAPNGFGEED